LALVRQWSLIRIGGAPSPSLKRWKISTKEFRENLAWAVLVPGESAPSAAVAQLLSELRDRNVEIFEVVRDSW